MKSKEKETLASLLAAGDPDCWLEAPGTEAKADLRETLDFVEGHAETTLATPARISA